jgi:hypothetical protein
MLVQSQELRRLDLENWVEFLRIDGPRWLNKKWQDFIVIWNDSSCEEIRCQDMISGECMCNGELESVYISDGAVVIVNKVQL